MKKRSILIAASAVVVIAAVVVYSQFPFLFLNVSETLTGYEEVPAVSTPGNGHFSARIHQGFIEWELSYGQMPTAVQQAHIHFAQEGVNGGISVFLCTNLGNGPAGTQPCPPQGGFISGIIRPNDVIGPANQGIAPGEFEELLAAMRARRTYVNVHTVQHPGGEIRKQISGQDHNHFNGENGTFPPR